MNYKAFLRQGFSLGLSLLFLLSAFQLWAAEPPPLVSILATDPDGAEENGDPASFTVLRDGPIGEPLTVHYRVGGTAINGVDYESISGSVLIPADCSCAPINIYPIDDRLVEGNETVVIALQQPLEWPPPYQLCWPSVALAGIEDNDTIENQPPRVAVTSPPDGAVFIGPVDITLTARAWDPDGRVRTVEFFAGDTSLGIVTNRPLILEPVSGDITSLDLTSDALPDVYPDPALDLERDATLRDIPGTHFRLLWEDAPAGSHVLTAVATDNRGASTISSPVNIRVTDPPQQPIVSIIAPDPVATEPNSPDQRLDTALFKIHRSGDVTLPLPVFYRIGGTAMNGVDYEEIPSMLVIPAGRRSANLLIEPKDDDLVEGRESVIIGLIPPVCIETFPPPPDCYLVGRQHVARAVILDNDQDPDNLPPAVRLVHPADGDTFLAPADIKLVADARDRDGFVVSVEFFEGTNSLGIVTRNRQISLDPSSETLSVPPFILGWTNVPPGRYVLTAEATDNRGASTLSRPVEIRVLRQQLPPVVTVTAPDPVAGEGGLISNEDGTTSTVLNTATFSVHRTGPADGSLEVHYRLDGTASNGVDYRELSGRVVIPTGADSADVVVRPIDDRECEGEESVILTITPPVCIAIFPPPPYCYVVGDPSRAKAVIRDNDICPTNMPPKVALIRPENGSIFRAPADITLVAAAGDPDGKVVSVEFFEGDQSLGTVRDPSDSQELFRLLWANVGPGAYVLTAQATDNLGATAVSEPVRIRVLESVIIPVVTIEATDPIATEGLRYIDYGDIMPVGGVIQDDGLVKLEESTTRPLILDTATLTVHRTGPTDTPLTVLYELTGTARNGVDYTMLSGEVTIRAGSPVARINILPLDDNLVEETETVVATLIPRACPRVVPVPDDCYQVGDPGRAVAYIRDNDRANQAPKVAIVNPQPEQTFPAMADILIEVTTRDPDGWVGRVEFFDGDTKIGEESIVFIQPPPPGQVQHFSMTWSNVPPGRHFLSARATDNQNATSVSDIVPIRVVEPCRIPVVHLTTPDPFASEQDPRLDIPADTGTFRVCRSCGTDEDLVVFYEVGGTAENGQDYVLIRSEVIIPAGSECVDIVIDPIDDELVEGTETVELRLVPLDCLAVDPAPAGCYMLGDRNRGVVYIRDNDLPPNQPPAVALISPPDGSVFMAPVDIRLVAEARDRDGWVETVEFFANGESLGLVRNHPWILDPVLYQEAPTETTTLQDGTVILEPRPDPIPVPINPFVLVWTNAPSGVHELVAVATDNDGAASTSRVSTIKVLPAPSDPIVTVVARDPQAAEGCLDPALDCIDTATFVVRRTGAVDQPLRVFYRLGGTAINGEDYVELPSSVVIPVGSSTAPVIIEPIDDTLVEGTERIIISLVDSPCLEVEPTDVAASFTDLRLLGCYQVGRARVARAVLYDNDTPPNQPPVARMVSPEDGAIFRAPADVRLAAAASDPDGRVVQVEFFEGTNSLGVVTDPILEPMTPDASIDPLIRPEYFIYTLVWTDVPAGKYVLSAVATDDQGEDTMSEPVEIKVVSPSDPPEVNIVATDPVATEQSPLIDSIPDTATFEVSRTGNTSRPLEVFYRIGGTASNGVDYDKIPYHVTIQAGESSATILINPIDDLLCEGTESIRLVLVPHPCIAQFPPPLECYVVGPQGQARAALQDDDICPPNQPPKVAMVRPHDGDVFRAPADILLCAEAKDPDGRVVLVAFFAGEENLGSVRLNTSDSRELFCLKWPEVPAGAYVLTAVATDNEGASTRSEPIRIRVIERPIRPVVTLETVDPVGSENGDPAAFVVSRNCCSADDLTVRYQLSGSALNGVDYRELSGQVVIPAGDRRAPIIVVPIDDNEAEGTESVVASLAPSPCDSNTSVLKSCYVIGHPSRDIAFIRDNDSTPNLPPLIGILSPPDGSVFSAPAEIDILAVGLDPDGWISLVEFFAGNTKIGESSIHFLVPPPPGELQTFELDWDDVPPGNYTLTARATDNRGASTVSGPIRVRVIDPCLVPVVTVRASDPFATEGGTTTPDPATFVIQRSCESMLPLVVRYSLGGTAENGVDYSLLTGEATLLPGENAVRVVVEPLDDDLTEGVESVVIELTPSPCANMESPEAGCYVVGRPGRAVAYIRDNENFPPRVALIRPYSGQVFKEPAQIRLVAETADPDGWVTQIEFLEGENIIGGVAILVSEPPPPGQLQTFEFLWENVPAGRYELSARVTDNGGASTRSEATPIVVEEDIPPGPPEVTVHTVDAYAKEGTTNTAMFRIRRSGPVEEPLTVHYQVGGTAENGIDYEEISSPITIPAGRRSASLKIQALADSMKEEMESVVIRLRLPNPSPVPPPYQIGRPSVAAAVIVDRNATRPTCRRLADGLFHVCLPGDRDRAYRVLASEDFREWVDIGSIMVSDEFIHFVDPETPGMNKRFYRVVPDTNPVMLEDD